MTADTCPVCGAPRPDGTPCAYCHAGGSVFSLGGLARVTARDHASLEALLPALAAGLEEALPGRVQVKRGGVLGRGGNVRGVSATVGDETFSLTQSGHRTEARVVLRVRGIDVKHEELSVPQWLDRLANRLAAYSASSTDIRPGLSRLIGS